MSVRHRIAQDQQRLRRAADTLDEHELVTLAAAVRRAADRIGRPQPGSPLERLPKLRSQG